MTTRTRQQVREHETGRLTIALAAAAAGLKSAEGVWGVWADSVRQDVEQRLGVTYTENDPLVLEDPEFSAALDVGTALDEARTAFAHLQRVARRAGIGKPSDPGDSGEGEQ